MAYEKPDAIRDLIAVVHACAADANADNPWCEVRMGKNGPYYRFPPKLQAMARLMKLMGWDKPEKVEVELKDNFIALMEKIRRRPQESGTTPASSDEKAEEPPDWSPGEPFTRHAPPDEPAPCSSPPAPSPTLETTAAGDYDRAAAIADLVAIIHARPSEAGAHHPLCENRMTSWGPYYRFPMKLAAFALLSRMLGWNGATPIQVPHDPDAKFKALREFIAKRK